MPGIDLLDPTVYNPSQFGQLGTVSRVDSKIVFQVDDAFGGWFGGSFATVDSSSNPTLLLRLRVTNFAGNQPIDVDLKLEQQNVGSQAHTIKVFSSDWMTVEVPLNQDINVLIIEHLPANAELEIDRLLLSEQAIV